jgi:hypothetical protein
MTNSIDHYYQYRSIAEYAQLNVTTVKRDSVKNLLQRTVKMKKTEVYSSIKSCIEHEEEKECVRK